MQNHNQTPDSPNSLESQGVRRLNRVPLFITGGLVLAILIAITYSYRMRLAEIEKRAAQTESKPSAATPSEVFREAPDGGFIPAKQKTANTPLAEPVQTPPTNEFDPDAMLLKQEEERIRKTRMAAALQAVSAPTTVSHKEVAAKPASERPSTKMQRNSPYRDALERHLQTLLKIGPVGTCAAWRSCRSWRCGSRSRRDFRVFSCAGTVATW